MKITLPYLYITLPGYHSTCRPYGDHTLPYIYITTWILYSTCRPHGDHSTVHIYLPGDHISPVNHTLLYLDITVPGYHYLEIIFDLKITLCTRRSLYLDFILNGAAILEDRHTEAHKVHTVRGCS